VILQLILHISTEEACEDCCSVVTVDGKLQLKHTPAAKIVA